jgi:ADP-heptose:LPS heptosyltransferase
MSSARTASAGLRLPSPLRGWLGRWLARPARGAPEPSDQTAVFKVDRLGDFVLALSALRLLLQHYGEERCTLIVSEQVKPLAAAEFPRTPLVIVPGVSGSVLRDWLPLRRRQHAALARVRFRRLVNLRHWPAPYHRLLLSWLTRDEAISLAPLPTAGSDPFEPAGLALPADYPATAVAPWSRELLAHRAVVEKALGRTITWEELRPRFTSVSSTPGNYLLVCPFASTPIRDYPVARLVEALRMVSAAPLSPARVIFSGTPDQHVALTQLATAAGLPSSTVRTNDDLPGFLRLVAGARAVLATESAAAHIATALDQPAVVLGGGGHYGLFYPWGDSPQQHWLTEKLPCFGCDWHCIHASTLCITQISPERIGRALQAALGTG